MLGIMIAYHFLFGESNHAPPIHRKPSQHRLGAPKMFTSPCEVHSVQPGAPSASCLAGMDCGASAPPALGHCLQCL